MPKEVNAIPLVESDCLSY